MKARTLKKDKVNIVTLGCSKNTVDSEVLLSQLRANDVEAHHQREKDDCNIIIVNTCGFIDNAKEESINTILNYADAKANGEIEKLYVTGCLSHRYMDELQLEIPEVDAWFGTLDLPKMLQKFNADYKHELIGERSISTPSHYAYLKISEGCNRTCSFCAIPLMRGNHVSKSMEDIIKEAKFLASIGVKEIMLIAQELTYYGLDIYKKRALADLLYALDKVEARTKENGLETWRTALNNVMPAVEVKSRRVGGATFQIPSEVRPDRKISVGIKWMILYARKRNEKSFADKLAGEIIAAAKGEGAAVKKRDDTHRMADANKAFSHFRA